MGEEPSRRPRLAWRPLVRAWHRDLGYLLVGLTFVYALSGLAVNHVADWDPNFTSYRATYAVPPAPDADDASLTAHVLERLGLPGPPTETYRASAERFDITLPDRRLHVNPRTGEVIEQGQKPRLLLRAANWLHLNRGKKAWTIVADLYAVGLLVLACSGMLMLPGKNGMRGRGAVLVLLGAAVPILYVVLSGGPGR